MSETVRHFFVTGGTRGIGKAIVLSQARENTVFFVNYLRDEESAVALQRQAQDKKAIVHLMPGNVADESDVQDMMGKIQAKTSRLDAFIHCAALGVFKPVSKLRSKDWDISLDVNAKAFLMLTQSCLPLMKSQGGNIITISSLGAGHYTPNYGAIGISKAALENLVRYLAVELAPMSIRVNCVSGGLIDTDSLHMFPDFETMKNEFLSKTPGGRLGKPEDIANVVEFLLSEKSAWIYGQTLIADGGYSLF